MSDAAKIIDTPIAPLTLDQLKDEQIDAHLAGIRERRLKTFKVYEAGEKERKETRNEKLRTQLEKQGEMFKKELLEADKKIDKLEARALKIRALRMEMEDNVTSS